VRDHRALLVDLLGHGFSDRPRAFDYAMESHAGIVASLLEETGVSGCVLVGHSMGGSIAVLLAASAPDLVARLVVAEGNLDPGPGSVSGIITAVDERTFVASGHAALVQRDLHAGHCHFAGSVAVADPLALYRSATSLIALRRPTYRELFAALSIPKTYVFGERTLPDPDVERLRDAGVDVRIVPAAGHDMMSDNPDAFAEAIADPR